ncbi:MAG: cell division protein SepF [Vampirovibrionales bacterium]|nr:cell division protein SepF [Vampirovibrionales bacterium]
MSGLLNRIKNWVSGDPFEEDVYPMEEDYDYHRPQPQNTMGMMDMELEEAQAKKKKNLKVVDHPNTTKSQVVVIEPRAFEEALEIIEHLRNKKSVILNLHLLDTAQSQRVVDFLSGATHAIDGNQQRIGDGVFIFTPNNVSIRSENEKAAGLEDGFWKQQQYG